MRLHRESRQLPYTCDQLFDLVLDIERYPEFVPGYRQTRILRREAAALLVEQRVGFGPASVTFHSRAEFVAPERIFVRASDGPFRRLEVEWRFASAGAACRVTAETRYQLDGLWAPMLSGWLTLAATRLLDAFAQRATEVYGAGA